MLLPSHLFLTIHESVGHPTELDRALGYEANYAGTSYITPDKMGKQDRERTRSLSMATRPMSMASPRSATMTMA